MSKASLAGMPAQSLHGRIYGVFAIDGLHLLT